MKPRLSLIGAEILAVTLLAACTLTPGDAPTRTAEHQYALHAPSVRPCWDLAVAQAQEWRPDAQIVEVKTSAKVPEGMKLGGAVNYWVESPSEDYVSFFFSCTGESTRTGTIDQNPGWPLIHDPPLSPDDFTVDSEQALHIGLERAGARYAASSRSFIDLFLTRDVPYYPDKTVWTVSFSIVGVETTYVYVDANTGEVLGVE